MSGQHEVYVAAIGMTTPVGFDAPSTAAAVRAGLSGYLESKIQNKKFLPMKLSVVPDEAMPEIELPDDTAVCRQSRYRRMLRIAVPAIKETLAMCGLQQPVPMLLAGPENMHGYLPPLDGGFIPHLAKASEVEIDLASSRLVCTGRAGGIAVIELAFRLLQQGLKPYVLIGGVDSYIDLDLLGCLERDDRISAVNTMDGFVPGEAAGFMLLTTEQGLSGLGQRPLAEVMAPGLGGEPGHRYSEVPYRGDGLASAVQIALAQIQGGKVQTVLSSLNGESFGVKEWGVAAIRNKATIAENASLEHPADCFGDIGAAYGPVMLGLAALGMNQGYMRGPSLVYCSSEREQRAACCISKIG